MALSLYGTVTDLPRRSDRSFYLLLKTPSEEVVHGTNFVVQDTALKKCCIVLILKCNY